MQVTGWELLQIRDKGIIKKTLQFVTTKTAMEKKKRIKVPLSLLVDIKVTVIV